MKGSIPGAIFWMILISLLLFWLPVFGPLIAGFAGGKTAGSISRAIGAVLLPALVAGILLFVFGSAMTGLPLIGFVAGLGGFVLIISHVGFLLAGAIIGGAMA